MKKIMLVIVCFILLMSFGPLSPSFAETFAPLDVITVDTITDSNEAGFQVCSSDPDDCSLRGAISLSNATTGGIGTIIVPTGIYQLSIAGKEENDNATGDLDILHPVMIQGAGKSSTIIQAGPSKNNGIDRVFSISYNLEGTASISDLTIRWGTISSGSDGGAGILHSASTSGTLILERVNIEENVITIDRSGGGLLSTGTLTIRDSSFVIILQSLVKAEGFIMPVMLLHVNKPPLLAIQLFMVEALPIRMWQYYVM
jgi:hypothetical protein